MNPSMRFVTRQMNEIVGVRVTTFFFFLKKKQWQDGNLSDDGAGSEMSLPRHERLRGMACHAQEDKV